MRHVRTLTRPSGGYSPIALCAMIHAYRRNSAKEGCTMATKNLTLPVTGMTCASCASRIERGLKKVGGVESSQVNLASEQATITYNPQQAQPHDLVAAV